MRRTLTTCSTAFSLLCLSTVARPAAAAAAASLHWESRPAAPAWVGDFLSELPNLKAQAMASIDEEIAGTRLDRARVIGAPSCTPPATTDVTGIRTLTGGYTTRTERAVDLLREARTRYFDDRIVALYAEKKRMAADPLWLPTPTAGSCGVPAGLVPSGLRSELMAVDDAANLAPPRVPGPAGDGGAARTDGPPRSGPGPGRLVRATVRADADRQVVGFIRKGEHVHVAAEGVWCAARGQRSHSTFGPGGGFDPAAGRQMWYLQAHLGDSDPIRVDGEVTFIAGADGDLWFDMADTDRTDNDGALRVVVTITPA